MNDTENLTPPDPQLIQELFDKDPQELSDQDIDQIVLSFRLDRMNYLQPAEEKKSSSKKSSKRAVEPDIPVTGDLLKDLGLDL